MNRQFKFRIWDKEQERMFYPGDKLCNTTLFFYDRTGDLMTVEIGESHQEWEVIGTRWDVETENNVSDPMQWTGLVDKNGNDIYEGDIIRLKYSNQQEEVFKVIWMHQTVRFMLIDVQGESWGFMGNNDLEVIGNIYQHPDLMLPRPTPAYSEGKNIWDDTRFAHIYDVEPIEAGNQSNYPDWQAAVKAFMRADGFSEHHLTIHDWAFARETYFKFGLSAKEAHKNHYYED